MWIYFRIKFIVVGIVLVFFIDGKVDSFFFFVKGFFF